MSFDVVEIDARSCNVFLLAKFPYVPRMGARILSSSVEDQYRGSMERI